MTSVRGEMSIIYRMKKFDHSLDTVDEDLLH